MKNKIIFSLGLILTATPSFAAAVKGYQVTGTVLDVTPTKITVQKTKEVWELNVGPESKGLAGVKKGDKVTIQYDMTVKSLDKK